MFCLPQYLFLTGPTGSTEMGGDMYISPPGSLRSLDVAPAQFLFPFPVLRLSFAALAESVEGLQKWRTASFFIRTPPTLLAATESLFRSTYGFVSIAWIICKCALVSTALSDCSFLFLLRRQNWTGRHIKFQDRFPRHVDGVVVRISNNFESLCHYLHDFPRGTLEKILDKCLAA